MALRKVQGGAIADNAITSDKIAAGAVSASDIASSAISDKLGYTPANETTVNSQITSALVNPIFTGAAIKVPAGTTAERPASPAVGMIRYNTTVAVLEQYTADGWVGIEPAPTITNIAYPNSQTAIWQGDTLTINGTGFKSGAIAKFLNPSTGIVTNADTTTRVSSAQLTATFPTSISTEGTYSVVVTNPSGLGATLDNALTVDGTPIWSTSSGSIGSFPANVSLSYSLVASEDTVNATMSLASGSLPTGVSISSAGVISGTPADVSADTVYSFVITATDAENQKTNRSFTMTVTENYQQITTAIFG